MDKLIKTLPAILAAAGSSEEVAEAACIAAWKHAVGEGLSSHAIPVHLENKALVVVVEDNIWQKQLELMRSQLLFRLNAVLGQSFVESIQLRIDSKTFANTSRTKETAGQEKAIDHSVPAELVSAAAGIEDVDLRRAFLGAAASCIRRLENKSEI
jgi:hypothetical protein